MKSKFYLIAALFALVVTFASCAAADDEPAYNKDNPAPFHIGIVTGTVSQSEDDLRGAEFMMRMYGETANGGMITHVTYPDNFPSEQETTISQIAGLADDPLMKVIVVNQAVLGTTEAFRRVREKRPDILLLCGEPQEDPAVITEAADVVTHVDNVGRGYTIPLGAQKMGAKTFVHISFPRHMSIEMLSLRRTIMEEACKDLGIKFVFETAPDPTSDVGVAGAQQYILQNMPVWIEKYGKDAAFFCTNDSHTEPLLKRIAEVGGCFVEADLPSPLMGYPGALGIDLSKEKGDWAAILKKVENAVIAAGGEGRMGTWAYSSGYTASAGLTEYGKRYVEGKATGKIGSAQALREIRECFDLFCPGQQWKFSYYTDALTGVKNPKFLLFMEDTYIFGKGYLHLTDVEIPEKYYLIHLNNN